MTDRREAFSGEARVPVVEINGLRQRVFSLELTEELFESGCTERIAKSFNESSTAFIKLSYTCKRAPRVGLWFLIHVPGALAYVNRAAMAASECRVSAGPR